MGNNISSIDDLNENDSLQLNNFIHYLQDGEYKPTLNELRNALESSKFSKYFQILLNVQYQQLQNRNLTI